MQGKILHDSNWATTSRGTPIELYKKTHTLKAPILFIGGVHGDEPEGVHLAHEFTKWLQENNSGVLHDWILVPCINPDGYKINQRTNGNGVDLNRNFPSTDWSPEAKAPRYWPGPHPGSEIETQLIVQLIEQFRPQLIVHFHSWEPCVVYTGAPGAKPAEIIGHCTPYPVREDIGYPTPGSLGQYGWLNHQTPVVCIEAQEHAPLETLWPQFGPGLQLLMKTADIL